MTMHPRPSPSPRAERRRLRAAFVATVLSASLLACDDDSPTETVVEVPLFASYALDMAQEVTATVTGDPDGIGTAILILNAELQTVCWSLTAANIALPATASHIHQAAAGVSGPIVLGLTAPGADGLSSGCKEGVDGDLVADILSDPSQYYVNVHTTEHPPGAIRAQLP